MTQTKSRLWLAPESGKAKLTTVIIHGLLTVGKYVFGLAGLMCIMLCVFEISLLLVGMVLLAAGVWCEEKLKCAE